MQAVGLHPDVFVVTSRFWQTTCTLVKSGAEAFCVDSPVLPDELELLPAIASQAGFEVVGCIATHADWDHLLGRYAFAEAPLGMAESSAARLRGEPGAAQRELREFDEEHYVERPGPLTLPGDAGAAGARALRAGRGRARAASGRRAHGRRHGGLDPVGVGARLRRLPLAGRDPVDLDGGSVSAYLATLERLEPLVARAAHVVPGHGAVLDSARALAVLGEDRAYLSALVARGSDAALPLARRNGAMKKIHLENVARVTG